MIAKPNTTNQPVTDVDTKKLRTDPFGNDASVDTKNPATEHSTSEFLVTTIGFIRVRKRYLKRRLSMSFDLVRAVRVNGKPRHQFILGLGSQKSPNLTWHNDCEFFASAIARMKEHGISESQRRHLVAEMIRKGARLPTIQDFEDRIEHKARFPAWVTPLKEMIAIIRGTP